MLHIITVIFTIAAAWKWGDWKNWQKYHATMVFAAMSNLLYNVLYYNHLLWQYKPYHIISDALSTFIILPLSALIFLTGYRDDFMGLLFRIIKFIAIYFLIELVYIKYEILVYDHGWNIWCSLAWLCVMFPTIALHYKKPLLTYAVSTVVCIIMIILFPVSIK